MGVLSRGLAAGAVGSLALEVAGYLDMALTGRPASDAPVRTLQGLADAVGIEAPDEGPRLEALGALSGSVTGLGIGIVAAGLRSLGVRLPSLAEAAVLGGLAMAATDGAQHGTGVTDVTTWSVADWARDGLPHLAYGYALGRTLDGLEHRHARSPGHTTLRPPSVPVPPPPLSRVSVLARCLAVGLATGARSSLGLVPPALASGRPRLQLVSAGLVAAELAVDKQPGVSSRLEQNALLARIGLGAAGALTLARHEEGGTVVPTLVGALGAVAGSVIGAAARDVGAAHGWAGRTAVAEDAVALGLTAWAWRSRKPV